MSSHVMLSKMGIEFLIFLFSCSLISGSEIAELKCWVERKQTHYGGPGIEQSKDINDRIQCINKCRESKFCGTVDIDTAKNPSCWYQQKDTFVATVRHLGPAATVTNYLYNTRCGELIEEVDVSCWHISPVSLLPGLEPLANVKTLAECLKACINKAECNAVNWDTNENVNCWIQTKPFAVSVSKLEGKNLVTNFLLLRDCLKLNAGLDLTYWRVSYLSNYASPGLTNVDKWDLKSCLNYCVSNEKCNMVDFDPVSKPPCWAQTSPFEILRGKLNDHPTATNYYFLRKEYTQNLANAASSAAEIAHCWFYRNNTEYKGEGLTSVFGAKTVNKCLKKCHQDSFCVGATFTASASEPCAHITHQKNVDRDDLEKKDGVTIFVPNKDCKEWKNRK